MIYIAYIYQWYCPSDFDGDPLRCGSTDDRSFTSVGGMLFPSRVALRVNRSVHKKGSVFFF